LNQNEGVYNPALDKRNLDKLFPVMEKYNLKTDFAKDYVTSLEAAVESKTPAENISFSQDANGNMLYDAKNAVKSTAKQALTEKADVTFVINGTASIDGNLPNVNAANKGEATLLDVSKGASTVNFPTRKTFGTLGYQLTDVTPDGKPVESKPEEKKPAAQAAVANKPKGEEVKPGIYVNQAALTKEEQLELFDMLKPYLEEQAAKTNKGTDASKMIGLGLRWDYKSNNPGRTAMSIPDVINPGNKNKYGYYNTSINGQPLAKITPRFRELMQKATGVDMTNYDGAIINLYESTSFISSHNDVDESKSAINYPVIGVNIGGTGNFSIESRDGSPKQLDLKAGTGYVFGVDGVNREVWHRTFAKPQDSFLPALTTKIDGKTYEPGSYRITITMRRVMPLKEGMPNKPAIVTTQPAGQAAVSTAAPNKILNILQQLGASNFNKIVNKYKDVETGFVLQIPYLKNVTAEQYKEVDYDFEDLTYDNLMAYIADAKRLGLDYLNTLDIERFEDFITLTDFMEMIKEEINEVNPMILNPSLNPLFDTTEFTTNATTSMKDDSKTIQPVPGNAVNPELAKQIDSMIESMQAIKASGKTLAFPKTGIGQYMIGADEFTGELPSGKITPIAPATFVYLSQKLWDNFKYANPNFDVALGYMGMTNVLQEGAEVNDLDVMEALSICFKSIIP
jgi:alkylated DNA repair dioxygenase AlkB